MADWTWATKNWPDKIFWPGTITKSNIFIINDNMKKAFTLPYLSIIFWLHLHKNIFLFFIDFTIFDPFYNIFHGKLKYKPINFHKGVLKPFTEPYHKYNLLNSTWHLRNRQKKVEKFILKISKMYKNNQRKSFDEVNLITLVFNVSCSPSYLVTIINVGTNTWTVSNHMGNKSLLMNWMKQMSKGTLNQKNT